MPRGHAWSLENRLWEPAPTMRSGGTGAAALLAALCSLAVAAPEVRRQLGADPEALASWGQLTPAQQNQETHVYTIAHTWRELHPTTNSAGASKSLIVHSLAASEEREGSYDETVPYGKGAKSKTPMPWVAACPRSSTAPLLRRPGPAQTHCRRPPLEPSFPTTPHLSPPSPLPHLQGEHVHASLRPPPRVRSHHGRPRRPPHERLTGTISAAFLLTVTTI